MLNISSGITKQNFRPALNSKKTKNAITNLFTIISQGLIYLDGSNDFLSKQIASSTVII